VAVDRIARGRPFRDTASSSADVNRSLAAVVSRAIEVGELPIVLAGSCPAAHGVLAGTPLAEDAVVLAGVRDLSPETERNRLASSAMDVFDPDVAPGVVDEPVPGGLSLEDAKRVIKAIDARLLIRAATSRRSPGAGP